MYLMDDITRDGNPVLHPEADTITFPLNEAQKQAAHDMMEYLYNSQDEEKGPELGLRAGVGLAAPQVGIGEKMIALLVPNIEDPDSDEEIILEGVMVNPKIISHSVEKVCLREGEGCLSVDDDVSGYVPRYARITITYDDLEGNHFKKRFKGYPAIVLQHEIDHLDGHLYYERINKTDPYSLGEHTYLLGDEF